MFLFLVKGTLLEENAEVIVYRLVRASSEEDADQKFRHVYFESNILSVDVTREININLP